ncbi:MAG: type II secretion system F family protein [Magnetospirillum sp.]|nr:type II secretion system F family protein [Magnetospirillum sp.]
MRALLADPLILVLLAAALAVLALGLHHLATERRALRRRLGGAPAQEAARLSLRHAEAPELVRKVSAPLLRRLFADDPAGLKRLRLHLLQAGYGSPHALSAFYAARLAVAAALPLAFLLVQPLLAEPAAGNRLLSLTLALAASGWILPGAIVARRREERRRACRDGFPDAVDLLLVCVEAGLGIDAAIARVGEEISAASPLLGEHFRLMAVELRAGKSRDEALRLFADRIGLDEVRAMATLLGQTVALGTSIGDALRAHADDMRSHRMLKAEERAQQMAVKLAFPLVGLIIPSLLVIVAAPAAIRLLGTMGPVLKQVAN